MYMATTNKIYYNMWTYCGDVSKIVREVTETREFFKMSLLQPYLHGYHRQIEKYPKIDFRFPLHCNSYNMYKVIIKRGIPSKIDL